MITISMPAEEATERVTRWIVELLDPSDGQTLWLSKRVPTRKQLKEYWTYSDEPQRATRFDTREQPQEQITLQHLETFAVIVQVNEP